MRHIYKPHTKYEAPFDPKRCAQNVFSGYRGHQCERNGKYPDEDGVLWCKQHHPDTAQKKKDEWERKFNAEQMASSAKWERRDAEDKFCHGVSTEFLKENSLSDILERDA